MPQRKVFLGVAEPWQGEKRWEKLGLGNSEDGVAKHSLLFVVIVDFNKRGVGDSWKHLNDVEFRTLTSDLRWERDIAQPGLLLRH